MILIRCLGLFGGYLRLGRLRLKTSFLHQRHYLRWRELSVYRQDFIRVIRVNLPAFDSFFLVEGGGDGTQAVGAVDSGFEPECLHEKQRNYRKMKLQK